MTSFRSSFIPVLTILLALIVGWYGLSIYKNGGLQRDLDQRANIQRSTMEFIGLTLNQPKPAIPSPHQVAADVFENTFLRKITSNRSLVYHSAITLSATLLGFIFGTLLGIVLAVGIVHDRPLDRSLMPWLITSQTIPILAIAPMIILILGRIGLPPLIPKALVATYLSFFPVAVGMVKGLRSPDLMHFDLMRTYNASSWQVFWKLRAPTSMPYLVASMKVAIAASLVGAMVSEMSATGNGGIGALLLTLSYYSNTIGIWAALVAGSVIAVLLVSAVGLIGGIVDRRMGARPA